MRKLKSLNQFKKENSNAILDASSSEMIRTFGCQTGCDDQGPPPCTETSTTSTENNDTCTATFNDTGKMIMHTHD